MAVIVGLAAQTTLGNLFAGMQIAFTDAIRIDDIVVVEEQWGKVEEITLTYVAVRVWDGTSVILPCTYFTTTPFRNWTHRGAEVTGTVELAVDWSAPLDDMRVELATPAIRPQTAGCCAGTSSVMKHTSTSTATKSCRIR